MAIRKISLDRKIDKFNLEEEHAQQADIFYHWANKAAGCKEERDRLKNELKKLEGQVSLDIYKGAYAIPLDDKEKPIKITLAVVEALLSVDAAVSDKRAALVIADGAYSKAAASEETMQQKRSSLKHLTELWINQYYQQSALGTGVKIDKTDEVSGGARASLNKKKTKK